MLQPRAQNEKLNTNVSDQRERNANCAVAAAICTEAGLSVASIARGRPLPLLAAAAPRTYAGDPHPLFIIGVEKKGESMPRNQTKRVTIRLTPEEYHTRMWKRIEAAGAEQRADRSSRQDHQESVPVHGGGLPDLSSAVGAGIGALLALADLDSSDDPEEQRRRYEAYLASQNLKFVMDIIVKLLEKLNEIDERRAAQSFQTEVRNESEQQEMTAQEESEEQEEQPTEEQTM